MASELPGPTCLFTGTHTDMLAFPMGAEDLNADPPECVASTIPAYPKSPQFYIGMSDIILRVFKV